MSDLVLIDNDTKDVLVNRLRESDGCESYLEARIFGMYFWKTVKDSFFSYLNLCL